MKKTVLAAAVAGVLGFSGTAAQASLVTAYNPYSYTGGNFTMLTPSGGLQGGTNDVQGSWNGTVYNSQSDVGAAGNMTLSSTTKFSGYLWTAHNIQVFSQGTYTFTETNNATQKLVVGAGQIGAHMLFDWNTAKDIGVADVWNVNSTYTAPFWTGGGVVAGDSWSGNNGHIWGLASTGGQGMPNGPFGGFKANFNLYNGTNVTPAPVPLPAAVWLFGSGLLGLVGVARRKRSDKA